MLDEKSSSAQRFRNPFNVTLICQIHIEAATTISKLKPEVV